LICEVRVDDALWDAASRLRRDDWRVSIADLVDDACLGDEDDHLLHVGLDSKAVVLAMFDAEGAPRSVLEVPRNELRPHVDEYLAVIRRMQHSEQAASSAQMHTLDMAKKVVHDQGAKTLARALPNLGRDHESYRRLFSLLLSVLIDVTALPGARAHRIHAR
jgi:uncharacterized protein (UPF0262 family)